MLTDPVVPLKQQPIIQSSLDAKPTAGIPIGAFLHDTDTGQDWRFDGKNWVRDRFGEAVPNQLVVLTDIMGRVLAELTAIRLGMIDAGTCTAIDPADVESAMAELQTR